MKEKTEWGGAGKVGMVPCFGEVDKQGKGNFWKGA